MKRKPADKDYVITIRMVDTTPHHQDVTLLYRRPSVGSIEIAKYTQHFTAIRAKPTVFKTRIGAVIVADRLIKACDRIQKDLKRSGINRTFTVRLKEWTEQ